MNRKRLILAVLFGILVISMAYAYLTMPRLEKAPPISAGQKLQTGRSVKLAKQNENENRIDFSFLEFGSEKFPGAKRNIFAFGAAPVAKIIEPVAEPEIPKPPIMDKQPVVMPTPIATVQKSLSQFTFLGFLDKGGKKTVFLSSAGNLFLVNQGERFGENQEFFVNSIEGNLLKVTHKGSSSLIEVPLIEKKKLSAAVSAPARLPQTPPLPPINRTKSFVPLGTTGGTAERQPTNPFENGKSFRDLIIEKNNPAEVQEEKPVNEDYVEGEVNGANQ